MSQGRIRGEWDAPWTALNLTPKQRAEIIADLVLDLLAKSHEATVEAIQEAIEAGIREEREACARIAEQSQSFPDTTAGTIRRRGVTPED